MLASELGIRERVAFTGARNDMPEVYASLDLMVLPSLVEAMPMCLLEAMAASKPIVASAVGSVPKVICPEETGLLVEPGNAEQLADSILRLLRDYEFSRSLGSAARELVIKRHSAQGMAQKYHDIYKQVLAQRLKVLSGVAA